MKLKDKFAQLKRLKQKAFVAYVPFGFPRPQDTKGILLALQAAGVDVIELGLPFSDPLADGPIIQAATACALAQGANTERLFKLLASIKGRLKVPLVIMTYYNPVFRFGLTRFLKNMVSCGVSGIMIVDLPLEESKRYLAAARRLNLETVFFITPTTSRTRAKKISRASRGFIYYISVTGITGPRSLARKPLRAHIRSLKAVTNLPICVGFGVHQRRQVEEISSFSEGVVVGSSIVRFIEANSSRKDFLAKLTNYVNSLCRK